MSVSLNHVEQATQEDVMSLDAQQRVELAEIRSAVQTLRELHHTLRHPYIAGCAECIYLKWLAEHDF